VAIGVAIWALVAAETMLASAEIDAASSHRWWRNTMSSPIERIVVECEVLCAHAPGGAIMKITKLPHDSLQLKDGMEPIGRGSLSMPTKPNQKDVK
jgi:hypothetical protein